MVQTSLIAVCFQIIGDQRIEFLPTRLRFLKSSSQTDSAKYGFCFIERVNMILYFSVKYYVRKIPISIRQKFGQSSHWIPGTILAINSNKISQSCNFTWCESVDVIIIHNLTEFGQKSFLSMFVLFVIVSWLLNLNLIKTTPELKRHREVNLLSK